MPATHTSSHYLDNLPSDSDAASAAEDGYDSEAHEESKSRSRSNAGSKRTNKPISSKQVKRASAAQPAGERDGPRASKRRRVSNDKEDYMERIAVLDSQHEDLGEEESQHDDSEDDDGALSEAQAASDSDAEDGGTGKSDEIVLDDHSSRSLHDPHPARKSTQPPQLDHDEIPSISASEDEEEDEAGLPLHPPHTLKRKRPSTSSSSIPTTSKTTTSHARPKQTHKPGILYLPTPPPYLKPSTLRSLLSPYTKHGISRIFLTPEPHAARLSRLKGGGNKKKLFVDGWVEFCSKRDAKRVVELLNGRTMGEVGRFVGRYATSSTSTSGSGAASSASRSSARSLGKGAKKGSRWRDDVWSLRYLHGFKWGDLVGERRDEEAERGARMDAERRLQRREVEAYVRQVERSKVERTRREKAGRREGRGVVEGINGAVGEEVDGGGGVIAGMGRQREAVKKRAGERSGSARSAGGTEQDRDGDLKRVLGKIF